MRIVGGGLSLWEALAGRAPGQPLGPADPDVWSAVTERLNPARARPVCRAGIESAALTSVRGVDYVMLRSPDRDGACYLRLTPQEWQLAQLMDGTRTVARLVAEFARVSGRLAPEQVTRVVADLAANRMLAELPLDAFAPLRRMRRRPWPARLGRAVLAAARGRRIAVARIDPVVGFAYRAGGKLLFTRPAAVLGALLALCGLGLFGWTWVTGSQPIFLVGHSYPLGAALLLGLNAIALACHEAGHALAAKHAGRRVPVAGFLVYFGIPSVFVDTTDVWLAGRRARLLTTAAGPATGLVLAGVAQVVGLVVPELAPLAFKLSFAWYVNVAFNLNPFMAMDGYYLLMDWLEIPNLRTRGLAWVLARLRRRPPRFRQLDREGRLVALYGMLAVCWLLIALNLGYRIYLDRIALVAIGAWRAGPLHRLLLVALIVALLAPAAYALMGWLGRRARRARVALSDRRLAHDLPRRYDALRASWLGQLATPNLAQLAAQARWVRPAPGAPLALAGQTPGRAYVVVHGAVEGRCPGDPPGTVRQRHGAGAVIGLDDALTGTAWPMGWHTVGAGHQTRLLAVPAGSLASMIGQRPGQPRVRQVDTDAVVARVSVPPWPGHAPSYGVHPPGGYPPLHHPPGPPPSTADDDRDRRFERRLWWLLILLLLLALLLTGANFRAGPAYSEMPDDQALLSVSTGTATVTTHEGASVLHRGQRRYVSASDAIVISDRGTAQLTFRGGGYTILCGGSVARLGTMSSALGSTSSGAPAPAITLPGVGARIAPMAGLTLDRGTMLAYTKGNSPAFDALSLRVHVAGSDIRNVGAARFAASRSGARVAVGTVTMAGLPVPVTGPEPSCGHGVDKPPSTVDPSPSVAPSSSALPSPSASPSVSASPSPSPSPSPRRTRTQAPPSSPNPPSSPTPSPTPANQPPQILRPAASPNRIHPDYCRYDKDHTARITVLVRDPDDPPGDIRVTGSYMSKNGPHGTLTFNGAKGQSFTAVLGPLSWQPSQDIPITVTVVATDPGKKSSSVRLTVTLAPCTPIIT